MFARRHEIFALAILTLGGGASADEVRGVITRVDPDKKEFAIDVHSRSARGLSMTFAVGSDSRISFGDQPGQLSDLQPGGRVLVLYETREGKRVVLGVKAHGSKRAAPVVRPS